MPTLRSQAHWLVAQKANARPKQTKELAYPTHGRPKQSSKLIEKMTENKYTCAESFENPQLSDSRVIIECIREACCYNNVQYQTL